MTTPLKTSEEIARDMLRACAEKALERLRQPEADVATIAKQMKVTAELVTIGIHRPRVRTEAEAEREIQAWNDEDHAEMA